jgi:hypothetical protein
MPGEYWADASVNALSTHQQNCEELLIPLPRVGKIAEQPEKKAAITGLSFTL